MSSVLTIKDLSFSHGAQEVLRRISMEVPRGVCSMLLGPNGAGKTTLFSLVTGLLAAKSGEIAAAGTPGIVFQQSALDADLSVLQNMRYFAGLHGMVKPDGRIASVLAALMLTGREADKVRTLNGGHRRRVEIARALLTQPDLMLLDEPTVGLDIPTRKALVAQLHELARKENIGVLWATHLVDEVLPEDRLIILHKGEIRAQGLMADVTGGRSLADVFAGLTLEQAA
jgi:ABC-2 type transport system ATP-binding protein